MGPPRLRQGLKTAAKARGEDMTKDVRWVRNWRLNGFASFCAMSQRQASYAARPNNKLHVGTEPGTDSFTAQS
jgi:hypothetical protein